MRTFALLVPLMLSAGCIGGVDLIRVGERVPDFAIVDIDGKTVGTAPARGKLLVLSILWIPDDPVGSAARDASDARAITKGASHYRHEFPQSSIEFLTVAWTRPPASPANEDDLRALREWAGANWSFALQEGDDSTLDRYILTGQGLWIISPDGLKVVHDLSPPSCAHDTITDHVNNRPLQETSC